MTHSTAANEATATAGNCKLMDSSDWGRGSRSYRVYCGPLEEQSTGTKISATAKQGVGLPFERPALGMPLPEVS
jgi:hypothetical protein